MLDVFPAEFVDFGNSSSVFAGPLVEVSGIVFAVNLFLI